MGFNGVLTGLKQAQTKFVVRYLQKYVYHQINDHKGVYSNLVFLKHGTVYKRHHSITTQSVTVSEIEVA